MAGALQLQRGQSTMSHPIGQHQPCPTVETGVWAEEHDWLFGIYKSPQNRSPKFRFPDLLGACVSLAVGSEEAQHRLVEYLTTCLTRRDPKTQRRRSCVIWNAQFEQLMELQRAAWNQFPNPKFDLNHITTGCVAIAMVQPEGPTNVLRQARENFLARAKAHGMAVN